MGPLCNGSVNNKVKMVYFHLNNIESVPYKNFTHIGVWTRFLSKIHPSLERMKVVSKFS